MKRLGLWAVRGVMVLVGLILVALIAVYGLSEISLRKHWPKAPNSMAASTDVGAAARGERIATIYGCHDCHGPDLTGRTFVDEMPVARVTGANVALAMAHQSDGDLARAIRQGVAADGRGLWVMPSDSFAALTDAETADLIAHLRTIKSAGTPKKTIVAGPFIRVGILMGQLKSAPQALADGAPTLFDGGPGVAQGRLLVRACMECHGRDLKGAKDVGSPDLKVAASYDIAHFSRLLRTGVAANDKKLGLMSEVAPGRFNAFSDEEIAALHAYLKARADAVFAAAK